MLSARFSLFLLCVAAFGQPFVNKNTQVRNFNHNHHSGVSGNTPGGEGGQLDIQALLDSIKSGGATATKVATVNTSLTSGFCLEADADGNIKTAASGAACSAGSNIVTSVFGRTGDVISQTGDYSFTQISGTCTVAQGCTGIGTLTGILQGNGTSPFTANAATTALTYLRRQANQSAVTYNFSPLADLNAGDYDWSQSPGGSITIGVNVITLTPGPLGVLGSATGHYVYLSGGTGTAEAVLIASGTCDGTGQSSCTIGFTAANTHSGAFTVASASSGIREAIGALPAAGGTVRISSQFGAVRTIYQTIVIGNGSSGGPSTKNNISIIGEGGGSSSAESNPASAGTTIAWAGPVGGTMFDIEGPFAGLTLQGLLFDCNIAARAATGLLSNHAYNSTFYDLSFDGCSGIAIKHLAYNNPSLMATGANNNLWSQIRTWPDGAPNASGMQVGGTSSGGINVAVSQNIYTKISLTASGTGSGLELRFTDSSTFEHLGTSGGANGILVTQVTVGGGKFPQAINFTMANIDGTTQLNDSSWSGTVVGGLFWPYNTDNNVSVIPVGTNGWSAGYAVSGHFWGTQTELGRWDATGAVSTAPAKSGTALPATCAVGAQFFKTNATPGVNLYGCTALNTWTALAGAGGGGTITQIIASAPLTGGTITATGTIGCPTCVTSHSINFVIGNGSTVITTGDAGVYPSVNFACTINRIDISAKQSGSVTVEVWKAAGAIPNSGNKISASAPLTLSSAQLAQNGSISGWTTSVSSGDVFGFNVASATTVTQVMGQIWCN